MVDILEQGVCGVAQSGDTIIVTVADDMFDVGDRTKVGSSQANYVFVLHTKPHRITNAHAPHVREGLWAINHENYVIAKENLDESP